MRQISSCVAMALLLTLAEGREPQPADKDLAKLQGTWDCVTHMGKAPDGDIQLVFGKDGYQRLVQPASGRAVVSIGDHEGTIKLDPSKSPAHIDFVGKKYTIHGIYKFDNGKLVLSLKGVAVDNPKERPTDFDDKDQLYTFKPRKK